MIKQNVIIKLPFLQKKYIIRHDLSRCYHSSSFIYSLRTPTAFLKKTHAKIIQYMIHNLKPTKVIEVEFTDEEGVGRLFTCIKMKLIVW